MKNSPGTGIPLGPLALILSKHYYGALSKSLEHMEIDRYYSVLYYLQEVKSCSQQQICNTLAIDKTAMVKVVDYLVKAGYIARRVNPVDRREHFISLTAKGRSQTRQVVVAFRFLEKAAFEGISQKEKSVFHKTMERLLNNLRSQPANDLFFNYKKTRRAKDPAARK